jgi:hypothetical protein
VGVEEREELQTEGIDNLFSRIIAETFPNLKKERVNAGSLQNIKPAEPKKKHPQTHHNQNTQHTEKRKNSESCKRQVTCKGKPIRIIDFSTQTLNARRSWKDIIQALKESYCQLG